MTTLLQTHTQRKTLQRMNLCTDLQPLCTMANEEIDLLLLEAVKDFDTLDCEVLLDFDEGFVDPIVPWESIGIQSHKLPQLDLELAGAALRCAKLITHCFLTHNFKQLLTPVNKVLVLDVLRLIARAGAQLHHKIVTSNHLITPDESNTHPELYWNYLWLELSLLHYSVKLGDQQWLENNCKHIIVAACYLGLRPQHTKHLRPKILKRVEGVKFILWQLLHE